MKNKTDGYSVELAFLLAGIVNVDPIYDRKITGITIDSREVKPGNLFIAYKGFYTDGADYLAKAIERGAVACVTDNKEKAESFESDLPIFYAEKLPEKISQIAAKFYGHPSRQMQTVGVTGTNGKSSITHYLAQVLSEEGSECGLIGTIGYGTVSQLISSSHTTPNAVITQKILSELYEQGITKVAMEVSSHALAQYRVQNIEFDVAVFTNLTQDHLDYHQTMQEYGEAKQRLFHLFGVKHAVINLDDPYSKTILDNLPATVEKLTYSIKDKKADVHTTKIKYTKTGSEFNLVSPWGKANLSIPLIGDFNVSNVLAVLASSMLLNAEFDEIIERLEKLHTVPGRMQVFEKENFPKVIIDFAHTPDALKHALIAAKTVTETKLYCVFGCGGERDAFKRPMMAKIAEEYSDEIIVTDDNPRNEDPKKIVENILEGFNSSNVPYQVIHDRAQAIRTAIDSGNGSDVVLIAGKGHESYQEIAGKRNPFLDADVVQGIFDAELER